SNVVDFQVGTVTSLDNPLFSEEQSNKGLWQPLAFMADGGAGIHFLEEFDPDRIPVLFVHGINGNPRNFTNLIENLDTTKYQAWVYSYPSGLRLSQLANGMYQFLSMLWLEYAYDELHIVAHSMGGLVSRGGLNLCVKGDECRTVKSYTTLSTPWSGVASAKSGVKWAPTVVPVWRDIDPDSEYVVTLLDTPLPPDAPFNLFFGFRQDSIFGSESSDGVIKLTSQLRAEAQEQAVHTWGYDEDHVSILSNESVIARVYQILDTNSGK
ncbi:MAG: esterase/lipase family protein, partial [Gammaproteobacteria bacterium]